MSQICYNFTNRNNYVLQKNKKELIVCNGQLLVVAFKEQP